MSSSPSYEQVDLFGPALIEGKEEISQKAGERNAPRSGVQRLAMLELIAKRSRSGATDLELEQALRMKGSSQRPRRKELEQRSLIVKADAKRNGCTVWLVSDLGRLVLAQKPESIGLPEKRGDMGL
ncbi:hypothetical protein GTQ99_00395 [Kineococcus sp. T13]|uniref:hypothetical protein n=1 Tax=Kineococcus vitellinus TaxID=2696565 RepID=UPI001412E90D|nr:hypothetical protein [Kineococcus vitellinus]NAZ73890.1 hypothetical protein [Kineococcus vitellinus]